MNEVSELYNNLFSFEVKRQQGAYPIHKHLKLGAEYPDLLDWIMDKIDFQQTDNVLDAGCGTGYSLIKLAIEKGVQGTGISVSENEISYAKKQLKNRNIENQISFEKIDFDLPFSNKYDKILAIESLKHSPHFELTLRNLCNSLTDKATFILADDCYDNLNSKLFNTHAKLWHAKSHLSEERVKKAFYEIGDFEIRSFDLTDMVPIRSPLKIILHVFLVRLSVFLTHGSWKRNLRTYLGGLLLEKLYFKKQVKYMVLIITK